ncbi:endogenous retrovirus group K member 7 Gag polyprotein-like [Petaurus breviceps papuanus]|uniref:endogenous retrovirus group K member 7 Gag polyprotein-like n=1 Tax=Petaurus breviceps papuanus TaxID=3040969 RepID=UPI0036DE0BB7
MGQGRSLPRIEPEDQGVVACQLYKLCRHHGIKIHIKSCWNFIKQVWTVCPWLQYSGIDQNRWGVVGQQMASFHANSPGVLTDEDFTIFRVVQALFQSNPPTPLETKETQVGSSIRGSSDEEEEGAPPIYPWGEFRCAAAPEHPELVKEGKWRRSKNSNKGAASSNAEVKTRRSKNSNGGGGSSDEELQQLRSTNSNGGRAKGYAEAADQDSWPPPPPEITMPEVLPGMVAAMSLGAPKGSFRYGARQKRPVPGVLTASIARAVEEGEEVDLDEWNLAFPVLIEDAGTDNERRFHRPVPFKLMKELKEAVSKYGLSSPYVRKLITNASTGFPWTPHDFKEVMGAVLDPGQFVAFKAAVRRVAAGYIKQRGIVDVDDAMNMITGSGPYATVEAQLTFDANVKTAVSEYHLQALEKLGSTGGGAARLVGLKQRANESPTYFVSRVQETVHRVMGRGEGTDLLITQLVKEGL